MTKSNITQQQKDALRKISKAMGAIMKNSGAITIQSGPALYNVNVNLPGTTYTVRRDVCNKCYNIIKETWDHEDWCELYKQEDLMKFLEDGIKAKKGRT